MMSTPTPVTDPASGTNNASISTTNATLSVSGKPENKKDSADTKTAADATPTASVSMGTSFTDAATAIVVQANTISAAPTATGTPAAAAISASTPSILSQFEKEAEERIQRSRDAMRAQKLLAEYQAQKRCNDNEKIPQVKIDKVNGRETINAYLYPCYPHRDLGLFDIQAQAQEWGHSELVKYLSELHPKVHPNLQSEMLLDVLNGDYQRVSAGIKLVSPTPPATLVTKYATNLSEALDKFSVNVIHSVAEMRGHKELTIGMHDPKVLAQHAHCQHPKGCIKEFGLPEDQLRKTLKAAILGDNTTVREMIKQHKLEPLVPNSLLRYPDNATAAAAPASTTASAVRAKK